MEVDILAVGKEDNDRTSKTGTFLATSLVLIYQKCLPSVMVFNSMMSVHLLSAVPPFLYNHFFQRVERFD